MGRNYRHGFVIKPLYFPRCDSLVLLFSYAYSSCGCLLNIQIISKRMKEIILFVAVLVLTAFLLGMWKKEAQVLPVPHLALSDSMIILEGNTQYHPSLDIYQRVYLMTEKASVGMHGIEAIRLIRREEDMTGIIYSYGMLQFSKKSVDQRFLDIANLYRFMGKQIMMAVPAHKCLGQKEKRGSGDDYCKMTIQSSYLIKMAMAESHGKKIEIVEQERQEAKEFNNEEDGKREVTIIEREKERQREEKEEQNQQKVVEIELEKTQRNYEGKPQGSNEAVIEEEKPQGSNEAVIEEEKPQGSNEAVLLEAKILQSKEYDSLLHDDSPSPKFKLLQQLSQIFPQQQQGFQKYSSSMSLQASNSSDQQQILFSLLDTKMPLQTPQQYSSSNEVPTPQQPQSQQPISPFFETEFPQAIIQSDQL